jgi:Methyltransferase domain
LPRDDRGRLRILDVGPSFQTLLLRDAFAGDVVDTLGFANRLTPPREGERHVDWDLTEAGRGDAPEIGGYGLIVLAEVIEHLAVSPKALLGQLAGWLLPGGVVVIQTPNALALHKRFRALVGRNPLGAGGNVGGSSHNPGHFREYTLAELREVGEAAGLEVESASISNYFRHPGVAARAYDAATSALPAGTRQGITAYLRRR